MAKRRGNNEGSIHKRENGTWRAQISIEGKRLGFSGKTRKECSDWLNQTLRQMEVGLTFQGANTILKDYMKEWVKSVRSSLRLTTWVQYDQIIRDYIIPGLGSIKIKDLRPGQIQEFYNRSVDTGVGLRTVQVTHAVLHRALNQAVKLGMLSRNPASVTDPPKVKQKEMMFYDEYQVHKLLIASQVSDERYFALYKLAVTTGMRQAELLGLKWQDVDWGRGTVKVLRQLKREKGKGLVFGQPKTQRGVRTIKLGNLTVDILSQHRRQQLEERKMAGLRWQENNLIFPSTIGTPTQPTKLLKRFKRLIRDAGLPEIRFHDLRHTAASLMLNNGVPVIVASRVLGHSNPSITLDIYGHLISSMQGAVAEMMDELTTLKVLPIAPQLHQNQVSEVN